jgi:hypothetical protein
MAIVEALIGILGTGLLGVIGWAVQIHSRVAVLEANYENLKELLENRFDEIIRRLDRMENGKNSGHKH